MATDSGTTFYTIFPENPMGSLNHGDHYVLVPDVNSTHDVRLTIDSCGGDFPVLRWLDRSRQFVALGDDFLGEGVATGLIWKSPPPLARGRQGYCLLTTGRERSRVT